MQAMIERSPRKARAIQLKGKGELEAYVRVIAKRVREEVDQQNVATNDINHKRMINEIAFHYALEEALSED